ncbi:MAG: hypothetical protein R3195_02865 [Gemmatimonadota bacterium]|nr:hypothetical protein [Gemmatimonadota bacterium]
MSHRTRTRRSLAIALLALALGAPAVYAQHTDHVAAFDGPWMITFDHQMGGAEWRIDLTLADHAIEGFAVTELGSMPIEGRQDGAALEFILFFNAPDHSVEFFFTGTLEGDTAEGAVTIADEEFGWTAIRVESAR